MIQLTRSSVEQEKRFHEYRRFLGFSSFSATLTKLPIKIDDFGFDVHKISFSSIVGASRNITSAMVILQPNSFRCWHFNSVYFL